MNQEQQMVLDFHRKYDCPIGGLTPKLPANSSGYFDDRLLLTRGRFLVEESAEYLEAASNHDLKGIVDALTDILYFAYGTAIILGVDLEPIFKEVQASNMSKSTQKDAAGKIQKGPDYRPPDIAARLREQGWKDVA